MANLTITNTFASQTTISSSQVNQNYTDIKTWLNNRDNATDYWLNMKVLATTSNPAEIKSSATDCEFDIDCTGTNGTPRISWKRSGTTYFTLGVDGAGSNLLKIGTTGLTTNNSMYVNSSGMVGFGTTPSSTATVIVAKSSNNTTFSAETGIMQVQNTSVTTNNYSGFQFFEANGNPGAFAGAQIRAHNAASASVVADYLIATKANGVSGGPVERFRIDSKGNVVIGVAALATNATDGFLYLPSCAGTPTGVPTTNTGLNACVYDSTAKKFWIYDGSWRGVAVT